MISSNTLIYQNDCLLKILQLQCNEIPELVKVGCVCAVESLRAVWAHIVPIQLFWGPNEFLTGFCFCSILLKIDKKLVMINGIIHLILNFYCNCKIFYFKLVKTLSKSSDEKHINISWVQSPTEHIEQT